MVKEALYNEVYDRTTTVATTNTFICGANPRRAWIALVNVGSNNIDVRLVNKAGTVTGRILLAQYGSVIFSRSGDMPWEGSIYAIAYTAATVLRGVEVERVEA